MCVNIIKSYCAYMFRALKKFLLFFLVFQVVMMPVSQAFAARHMHDISHEAAHETFHETMRVSAFPASAMVGTFQYLIKLNRKDSLSDTAHVFPQSQKVYLQSSGCGKRNGHKGDCDSCQCMPIVATPVFMQVTSVFTVMESYNVKLVYPLYNVIMAPPLRPPTS